MMVCLVIPALNEAEVIGEVVRSVPRTLVNQIIVVDNGSTDGTGQAAKNAGAILVSQPARGYGRACRAGVNAAVKQAPISWCLSTATAATVRNLSTN